MINELTTTRTQVCQTCGGDGWWEGPGGPTCPACRGGGEVPGTWWWDDVGMLHKEAPRLTDQELDRLRAKLDAGTISDQERRRIVLNGVRKIKEATMPKRQTPVDPSHAPTTQDGFRPRKFRPEGWKEQALADGTIADPDAPCEEVEYGPDVVVFQPPAASLKGDAVDPQ